MIAPKLPTSTSAAGNAVGGNLGGASFWLRRSAFSTERHGGRDPATATRHTVPFASELVFIARQPITTGCLMPDLPQITDFLKALTPLASIAFYVWLARRSPPRSRTRRQPATVDAAKRRDP